MSDIIPDSAFVPEVNVVDVEEVRRMRLLVDLNHILFTPNQDVEEIVESLCQFCVPRLGEACIVDVQTTNTRLYARTIPITDELPAVEVVQFPSDRAAPAPTLSSMMETARSMSLSRVSDEASTNGHRLLDELQSLLTSRSTVQIPLIRRDRHFGTISVRCGSSISPQWVESLAADIGAQVAVVLDNAILLQSEHLMRQHAEQTMRRVAALHAVSASLSRAMTIEEILTIIIPMMVEALGSINGSLALLSDTRTGVEVVYTVGYAPEVLKGWERFPITADVPLAVCIRDATSLWYRTSEELVTAYPHLEPFAAMSGNQACASIPLTVGDSVIGAIGLSFQTAQSFLPDDQEFILAVAEQCAHAIERVRLVEQVQQANRAKDRFLDMVSHELRTPLTPIFPALHVIEEENLSEIARELLGVIQRNLSLELNLIDDLLNASKVISGTMVLYRDLIDVHLLLASVVNICQSDLDNKSIAIMFDAHAERTLVWGDAIRLEQVFWNLLKNAIKFTEVAGSITIDTRNDDAGHVFITVEDTGIGIDPSRLTMIFDPFRQEEDSIHRRYGGLGLGLAISKAIVELHGGSVTAFSQGKGHGSIFTVMLDTHERPVPIQSSVPMESLMESGRLRVLLVGDHEDTARVIAVILSKSGFSVMTAASVAAALEVIATSNIDVIISDLDLPDGTGYDLIRRVHATRRIPAIAISGFGSEKDIAESYEAGFVRHVKKPVLSAVLVKMIRQVVR